MQAKRRYIKGNLVSSASNASPDLMYTYLQMMRQTKPPRAARGVRMVKTDVTRMPRPKMSFPP